MASLIFLALGVIIFSGILSMVEASLFSYSVTKARLAVAQKKKGARRALKLRENPLRAIATLVILSSAVGTLGSIAVGIYAASIFSSRGLGIFSAILTFFSIIFAEIIPKNIGEKWNNIIFRMAALPLRLLAVIFTPLILVIEAIVKPFTSGASPFMTSEEEIAILTSVGAKEGTIEPYEAEMIQRVFRLNDVTASDMMTSRLFVSFIDGEKTVGEAADFIKKSRHSRLPVYQGDKNNIIGIVHQRDLLRALAGGELDRKVAEYVAEAIFVPESRLGDDLLRDFQEKKTHLAVVVNEYGDTAGVVGLEDVLEELVGEIIDEKDVAPELIKRVSKNEIIAHGQTKIEQINHFFNTEIRSRKTLNGFLLAKFGKTPEVGSSLETDGLTFRVEEATPKQIERARIVKKS
ncbi:MAG: hemolysin family protein [Candidatus Sungiibacteriota bacterium]